MALIGNRKRKNSQSLLHHRFLNCRSRPHVGWEMESFLNTQWQKINLNQTHNESNVFVAELDYITSYGFCVALILNTQYAHCALPSPSHHPGPTNTAGTSLNHLGSDWKHAELQCFYVHVKYINIAINYRKQTFNIIFHNLSIKRSVSLPVGHDPFEVE